MAFTKLYLTTTAAGYTPATLRGAWDDTSNYVTKELNPSKTGGGNIVNQQQGETSASPTWDVLLYRGVTGPLAAQTINCNIDCVLGVIGSDDQSFHIHIYVTQGDSDTPRGTLLSDYLAGTDYFANGIQTGKNLPSPQAIGSLAIQDGDRMVIEIGYRAYNIATGFRQGAMYYGTSVAGTPVADLADGGTDGTTKAGFITFSASIDEFVAPQTLTTSFISSVTTLYAGTVLGQSSIAIPHQASAASEFSPTVAFDDGSVSLSHIASTVNLFAPSLTNVDQGLFLPHLASTAVLYSLGVFDPNVEITSGSATTFEIGTSDSFTVTTTGSPGIGYTGFLPPGLTFTDNGDGTATIAGTPLASTAGSYVINIVANNGFANDVETLVITIDEDPALPVFTSPNVATLTQGDAETFTVTTMATPTVTDISMSGTLPAGLSFTDNGDGTATISGTPTGYGLFNVTFTADNGSSTASQMLALTIELALQAPSTPINVSEAMRWWAEIYLDDETLLVSPWNLQHPADYYGGHKHARVKSVSPMTVGISDDDGLPQTSGFKLQLIDHDNRYREIALSGNPWNRTVVVRMATDLDALANIPAHVVAVGQIEGWNPNSDATLDVDCKDFNVGMGGLDQKELVIPHHIRTRERFPTLPANKLETVEQWVFGNMLDVTSPEEAPVLQGDPTRGSFFVPQVPVNLERYKNFPTSLWFMGWADIITGPMPPTNVVATPMAALYGHINVGDFPDNRLYIQVTAVNASGVEGDPHIFNTLATTSVVIEENNSIIRVTWTPSVSPGVIGYRVYCGYDFFNLAGSTSGSHYVESFGPMAEITAIPRQGTEGVESGVNYNITPGGHLITFSRSRFYTVQAVTPTGITGVSQIAWTKSYPYDRPTRLEWRSVESATSYIVYIEDTAEGVAANRWTYRFETTLLFFNDDFTNAGFISHDGPAGRFSEVPCEPVGIRVAANGSIWHEYQVACHACKEVAYISVDGVVVNTTAYGNQALVPGKPGYSAFFSDPGVCQYRDVNGVRRTSIFGRGQVSDEVYSGLKKLTAGVRGVETVGDSSGEVITNIFDIYEYILNNLVFGKMLSVPKGPAYFPQTDVFAPPIPFVNHQSFVRAKEITDLRVEGGYTGAFALASDGKAITVNELLKRLNIAAGVWSFWNFVPVFGDPAQPENGYSVVTVDDNIDLETTREFSGYQHIPDAHEVLLNSFDVKIDAKAVQNLIVYNTYYNFSLEKWSFENKKYRGDDEITDFRAERPSPPVPYMFTRNSLQVEDMNLRRLATNGRPLVTATWMSLLLTSITPLGSVVRLTHAKGLGTNGYVKAPLLVKGRTISLQDMNTTITARPAGLVTPPVGGGGGGEDMPVITYDFSGMTGPLYPLDSPGGPDNSLPDYWQTPYWTTYPGYADWGPPLPDYPNLLIAEEVDVIDGQLTVSPLGVGYPNGGALFGIIDPPTHYEFEPLFSTHNNLRTVYAEASIEFSSARFDLGNIIYAPVFQIYATELNYVGFTLFMSDFDGPPSGDIEFHMAWQGTDGDGDPDAPGFTLPRASVVDQTLEVRLEVRPSTPVDALDDQNFSSNADGVIRIYINGVMQYEKTDAHVAFPRGGAASMLDQYEVGAIALGLHNMVGAYNSFSFGYFDLTE
jgi:hypothetical protein